ncbi:MAG TPA: 30S ribosomal protein S2 [Candidatus Paceibacterota bacterium]|jgi:small subunit ribosomal protein S2|nr:30S ribosomal protein S2 [Candidatus Paceibacterota bacterium]
MSVQDVQELYDAGVHFGYARARRHPTAAPFIFGTKDRTDIFDLEETKKRLDAASAFLSSVSGTGKAILFVGGKPEAVAIIESAAEQTGQPYVAGRWIGGTLTNFKNIRKRIERLLQLEKERESGELEKYTKRERLMIDREIEELQGRFGGLVSMSDLPAVLVIVDSRHERTAVMEAIQLNIPIVALSSSDCDFSQVRFPIPGSDTSVRSIRYVVNAIIEAVQEGKKVQK